MLHLKTPKDAYKDDRLQLPVSIISQLNQDSVLL